jgi:hypothetical protein
VENFPVVEDFTRLIDAGAETAGPIGTSFQMVYREIKRNSKPDGTYQPWWAPPPAADFGGRLRAATSQT